MTDMEKVLEKLKARGIDEDRQLYRLCVADLVSVLTGRLGVEVSQLSSEELEKMVAYVEDNLAIPYDEYLTPLVSCFLQDEVDLD